MHWVDSVLRKKEAVGLIVAGFICEGFGVLKIKTRQQFERSFRA